ncbi:MAG: hypothetical protein Kow00121_30340 [Elainellaceae cyanobacterium]
MNSPIGVFRLSYSRENVCWLLAEMQERATVLNAFYLGSINDLADRYTISFPVLFIVVPSIHSSNELYRLARCGRHVAIFVFNR